MKLCAKIVVWTKVKLSLQLYCNNYKIVFLITTKLLTRDFALYILIDLEIHIVFINLSKICKSGGFPSDLSLCIFN